MYRKHNPGVKISNNIDSYLSNVSPKTNMFEQSHNNSFIKETLQGKYDEDLYFPSEGKVYASYSEVIEHLNYLCNELIKNNSLIEKTDIRNDGSIAVTGTNGKTITISDEDVRKGLLVPTTDLFFSKEYTDLYRKINSEYCANGIKVQNGQVVVERLNGETIRVNDVSEIERLSYLLEKEFYIAS